LAVAFAVELRLKIITELYMREMSPTQFYKEFGGGSPARVARNFQRLQEHGWLTYIRSAPSANGRGKEKFYRATELAFVDAELWALLPKSVQVAFSWNSFKQIAEEIRKGMEAAVSEDSPMRDLTRAPLLLDRLGWERVIEAVGAQFISLFEEQKNAQRRASHTGEALMRVSIIQIAFESPIRSDNEIDPSFIKSHRESSVPFSECLSPILADDICMQIVREANRREISVIQFHREHGGAQVSTIRRRFRKLVEVGWLREVRKERGGKRRGAVERFYRATGPAIGGKNPWADVSASLRSTENWKTFERLSVQIKEAMKAGTFDARPDRYLAWSLIELDEQGWEGVIADLDALQAQLVREQEAAQERLKKPGAGQVAMTVALGAFESPKDMVKAF
jgi:DNA-binding PadR family transcriptional regulator